MRHHILVLIGVLCALSMAIDAQDDESQPEPVPQPADMTKPCEVAPGSCTDFRWDTDIIKTLPGKRRLRLFVPSIAELPTFVIAMDAKVADKLAADIHVGAVPNR